MDSSNAQHVLKSNAVTEIYTPKDEGEVAGWIDCLCDDPSDCHCKTAGPHYGSQSPEYVKSLGYDLQLQGSSRRPRDLMSLRGLEIYSAQAAITRDRNRHWPEPTPFFREYLRHFEHDPVEWKSPKYQAYREKQIQLIEKKKPNPWPANIEYHFQRALQLFGGCGRDKEDLGGKLSGCNEWMAWCIFVETGVELHRKKVSSHIQVLKQKLYDNPEWMHFARPSIEAAKKESNDRTARRRQGVQHGSLPRVYGSTVQRPMQLVAMEDQRGLLPSNVFQGPKIHTATFTMYWLDRTHEAEQARSHTVSKPRDSSVQHIYTELQSDVPTRPQGFHDIQDWRNRFPDLQLFDENDSPVPTYLFNSGLKLKDTFSERNAVVTDLDVCLLNAEGYTDWTTHTQIHEETNKMAGAPTVQRTEKKGQHVILRRINLETMYWAKLFGLVGTRMSLVRKQARETGDVSLLDNETRNVQSFLGDLYLSQQMWATCEQTRKRKCFAIFLWRFHLVGPDVAATTNWRPLQFNHAQIPFGDGWRDNKSVLVAAWDGKSAAETAASSRMQLRLRDDLWDSGRCWKDGSSQLQTKDENPFPSAESSPTTDLTTDAGSSTFSSTSTSFALSNGSTIESMSQGTTQKSFDSYDITGYCESFDVNQDPAAWFQSQVDPTNDSTTILHLPECSPYDASSIDQLSLPQDQFNNVFGQSLNTKGIDPLDTPHSRHDVHVGSLGPNLSSTPSNNRLVMYGDSVSQPDEHQGLQIAFQYQQPTSEQDVPSLEHHNHTKSPLAGPQSRMPNSLEGYILHLEQEAQRQQHGPGRRQQQQQQQHPQDYHAPHPHLPHQHQTAPQQYHHQQHRRIEEVSDNEAELLDPHMTAVLQPSGTPKSDSTLTPHHHQHHHQPQPQHQQQQQSHHSQQQQQQQQQPQQPQQRQKFPQEGEPSLEQAVTPTTPATSTSTTGNHLALGWRPIAYAGPSVPSNGDSLPTYVSRYAESATTGPEGFQSEVQDWQFVDVGEGLRQEN